MIKNTQLIKVNDQMHHCASIEYIGDDLYVIAFYTGPECRDEQHVVVCVFYRDQLISKIEFEPKTGNPIIFKKDDGIYLIYSKFDDIDDCGNKPARPVDRWKFCRNFICELEFNNELNIINCKEIVGSFGRLVRSQPIMFNNNLIIPMYRELDPLCEIWTIDHGNVKLISSFGAVDDEIEKVMKENDFAFSSLGNGVAIQPALLNTNDGLVAVCRNVCRGIEKKAWLFKSPDAINWSLSKCGFNNYNSSMSVIRMGQHDYFVHNPNVNRDSIVLSRSDSHRVHELAINLGVRESYSYPNMMFDGKFLNIVHTNELSIAWYKIDESMLNEIF